MDKSILNKQCKTCPDKNQCTKSRVKENYVFFFNILKCEL